MVSVLSWRSFFPFFLPTPKPWETSNQDIKLESYLDSEEEGCCLRTWPLSFWLDVGALEWRCVCVCDHFFLVACSLETFLKIISLDSELLLSRCGFIFSANVTKQGNPGFSSSFPLHSSFTNASSWSLPILQPSPLSSQFWPMLYLHSKLLLPPRAYSWFFCDSKWDYTAHFGSQRP